MSSQYFVHTANWKSHKNQLKKIREQVFIQEQNVPVELEWDDLDKKAFHVLAEVHFNDKEVGAEIVDNKIVNSKKLAIGTARIIINNKQAHIGRMAVLSDWRGKGVGSEILLRCINECKKQSVEKIVLNAQIYVTQFYQKAGFKISSDEFLDAGIAHKQMTLLL